MLFAGGAGDSGGGAGVGMGVGVGDVVDVVGDCATSVVVLATDAGAIGVTAASLPQPEISAQTTTESAAAEQIKLLPGWDNQANRATCVPARTLDFARICDPES